MCLCAICAGSYSRLQGQPALHSLPKATNVLAEGQEMLTCYVLQVAHLQRTVHLLRIWHEAENDARAVRAGETSAVGRYRKVVDLAQAGRLSAA